MITTQQIKQYLKREYLLSLFFQIGPVFLLTAIFGTALVVALEKGTKWLFLCVVAYMAIAVGVFFKDKFHYLLIILSSCAGIGIQYKLLSHGTKNELVNHYGGAMAEPVLNLIDFPIFLLVFYALFDILANKRALPKWSNIDYWILAFILSSMISLINTHEYGLYFWEIFRYLKYYLLYWVLRTYLTKPLYYWTIYIISVSLLFIHGFVSALQYFLYFSLPVPVGGVSGSHLELVNNQVIQRAMGVLGHSNTFSAYLSIILGVALVLLFVRYSYIFKPLPIPFILFGILALTLTFSRNGWMILPLNA